MLWFDGRLHDRQHATFDLTDRGLTLGDGVFDTAMALGGRIAFETAHVERLSAAADILGFAVDREQVIKALRELADAIPYAAIRTTVTRGSGRRGLVPPEQSRPVHFATAAPLQAGFAFSPISLMPSTIRRNDTSPTSRIKSLNYLDAILANHEARRFGFDDAVLLNTRDNIACTTTANLFIVVKNKLITPPISDGVLPGIIRQIILEEFKFIANIETEERSFGFEEVLNADAVFVTNSLRLIGQVKTFGKWNVLGKNNTLLKKLSDWLRNKTASECSVDLLPS